MKRVLLFATVLACLGLSSIPLAVPAAQDNAAQDNAAQEAAPPEADAAEKPDEAAVERARHMVRMLDDIYKQTIVLITDKYVHDEDDFPAGSAAVALFEGITEAGWHDVRLIDASGDPYEPDNVARDEFEKKGVERLKQGENYVEQVVRKDGEYRLRALTPVPVVMEKCIMCHAHYADAEEGEPIGAITYSIPLD